MFAVQPVIHHKYFTWRRAPVSNCPNKFYLSWEDALWDVVQSLNLTGGLVLVPEFFCMDVIENMHSHGLKVEFYRLDKNLQPIRKNVIQKINTLKPKILVLLHPAGITNKLVNKSFIDTLPRDLIVLEDAVHRVVNPHTIILYSDKHICITSLRKVVPIQGSFLYANKAFLNNLNGGKVNLQYSLPVVFLWGAMQGCLLVRKGARAERLMQTGYDLIGDEQTATSGQKFFALLYSYLNFDKIAQIKTGQVAMYKNTLQNKLATSIGYIPKIKREDFGNLKGLPIVMPKNIGMRTLAKVRARGIYLRAELENCPWNTNRTVCYLPMGAHLTLKEVEKAARIFVQVAIT